MPRRQTFHDKAMMIQAKLGLYVVHGDVALDGQSPQEFAAEVMEVLEGYRDFRNIINAMVGLDDQPLQAAQEFLEYA